MVHVFLKDAGGQHRDCQRCCIFHTPTEEYAPCVDRMLHVNTLLELFFFDGPACLWDFSVGMSWCLAGRA